MKVILIENNDGGPTPSIWAEAINQFFASRGSHCVYIRPDMTGENKMYGLLDSSMDSSDVVIVETHGEAMKDHALIPDYTITIQPNTNWHMEIGRAALRARLDASLGGIDQIDNERVIADCLKVAPSKWGPDEQQRLAEALVALGWISCPKPNGKLEWRRQDTLPVQLSEEA